MEYIIILVSKQLKECKGRIEVIDNLDLGKSMITLNIQYDLILKE